MIGNIKELESIKIVHPEAKNSSMKVLVSELEGWQDHVMRLVEVEVGGFTPKHAHPWPHINFMVSGTGELMIEGKATQVEKGSYAFVPSNTLHQFKNTGKDTFKFICIVPKRGHVI